MGNIYEAIKTFDEVSDNMRRRNARIDTDVIKELRDVIYKRILSDYAGGPTVFLERNELVDQRRDKLRKLLTGDLGFSFAQAERTRWSIDECLAQTKEAGKAYHFGVNDAHLFTFKMAPWGEHLATVVTISPEAPDIQGLETLCSLMDSRLAHFQEHAEDEMKLLEQTKTLAAYRGVRLCHSRPAPVGEYPQTSLSSPTAQNVLRYISNDGNILQIVRDYLGRVAHGNTKLSFFDMALPLEDIAIVTALDSCRKVTAKYLDTLFGALDRGDELWDPVAQKFLAVELADKNSTLSRSLQLLRQGRYTNALIPYGFATLDKTIGITDYNDVTQAAAENKTVLAGIPRTHVLNVLLRAQNDYPDPEHQTAHHRAAMPEGFFDIEDSRELGRRHDEMAIIQEVSDTLELLSQLGLWYAVHRSGKNFPFSEQEVLTSVARYDGLPKQLLRVHHIEDNESKPLFGTIYGYNRYSDLSRQDLSR